jgi:two-component system, NarL family, response regulator DevR
MAPIRVVIADHSEIIRRGIKDVLTSQERPVFSVVGEAATPAEALAQCLQQRPDVLLLDIRLRGGSGLSICREVSVQAPATRVLVLTCESSDALVYESMIAGVSGYLTKDVEVRTLVEAIEDVASGRSIFGAGPTRHLARTLRNGSSMEPAEGITTLSAQQREVLRLVAGGFTNKQVGEHLKISENTVRNYLVRVFEKLGVKRRAQAAAMMVQHATTTGR